MTQQDELISQLKQQIVKQNEELYQIKQQNQLVEVNTHSSFQNQIQRQRDENYENRNRIIILQDEKQELSDQLEETKRKCDFLIIDYDKKLKVKENQIEQLEQKLIKTKDSDKSQFYKDQLDKVIELNQTEILQIKSKYDEKIQTIENLNQEEIKNLEQQIEDLNIQYKRDIKQQSDKDHKKFKNLEDKLYFTVQKKDECIKKLYEFIEELKQTHPDYKKKSPFKT